MNKSVNSKVKYCIQWETHPKYTMKGLCSLMEHQSLVDIAICCGNNTMHAHKCVLAACSPMFKDAFEKNSAIEQVIISGCDFSVMKSVIEIMYCGETTISEEYIKYLIAAAKLFQMKSLENLFSERNEYHLAGEEVFLPFPQFLTRKPKYPTAYTPLNHNPTPTNSTNILKPINYNLNDPFGQRRFKRKYIRAEAEKACAKEAQASRMALANLQKEIANAPQVNSFIIEDTCTETTVENFIPHTDENFSDKLNELQVVNYSDLENAFYVPPNQFLSDTKPQNMVQFTVQNNNQNFQGLTADKIKHILGHDVPTNVEIMYKTSDGNFVTVTDEVLQNLSKGGLQYQVVDENGHVGEVRELQVLDRDAVQKIEKLPKDAMSESTELIKFDDDASSPKIAKMVPESTTSEPENYSQSAKMFEGVLYESKPIHALTKNDPDLHGTAISENILSSTSEESNFGLMNGDTKKQNNALGFNNKVSVGEVVNGVETKLSPRKTRSSMKFSPDMFFADMPNETAKDSNEKI